MGVGIGWFLGSDAPSDVQAASGAGAPARGPARTASSSASPGLAEPTVASAPERAVAQAQVAEVQVDEQQVLLAARAALADQPVAASAGEGRIEGLVLDYLGAPVVGAQVQLVPYTGSERVAAGLDSLGGLPDPASLEDTVMGTAKRWARGSGARRLAETSGDGGFAFEGLPEGSWTVSAGLEGWRIARVSSRPSAIPTGGQVDFEAVPRIAITLDVLGAGGQPLEEVTLELHSNGGNATHYTWTRSAPDLRVVPGSYKVRAISEPEDWPANDGKWMSQEASEALELTIVVGDPPRTETLQLKPRTGIYGRILLPREPLEGGSMRVSFRALTDGAQATVDLFGENNDGQRIYSEASYAFLDLEPGRYAVGFMKDWRGDALVVEEIEVGAGLAKLDLTVPAPEAQPKLIATVLDSEGRPVNDVRFQWRRMHENSSWSGGADSKLLPAGGYRITPSGDAAEGYWEGSGGSDLSFFLTATSASQGSQQIELRAGQETVEFQLESPAELEITVLGYDAARYGGRLSLMVFEVSEDNSQQHFGGSNGSNGSIDSAGVQRMEGLTPGKKNVQLSLGQTGGNHWGGTQIASEEITVEPGFNRATITMPALGEVRVSAPELGEDTNFMLTPEEGGNSLRAQVDEDHRALFEDVPHGRYSLSTWRSGDSQVVDVPTGEVLWKPRKATGMRIQTLEPDHPFSAIGLAAGDVLLEIDGEAVAQNTLWMKLYTLSTSPTSSVAILYQRGSERGTAEVSGSQVDRESLGQGLVLVPVYD